jgi:ubiquitin carboxyl-terminal hydrolase L5
MSWCLLESDPGVFSELLVAFGTPDAQVEELISLDDDSLAALGEVHGLLFLFKWDGSRKSSSSSSSSSSSTSTAASPSDVFFARQIVNNACGTLALLHILLNRTPSELPLGPALNDFHAFVGGMDAETAGSCLGSFDPVRLAHNAFARPEPFVVEEKVATKDDDVFHFIAYSPINGAVYELDGLAPAPVNLGAIPSSSSSSSGPAAEAASAGGGGGGSGPLAPWLLLARDAVQKRIEEYSSSEIKFNLMAVVKSKRRVALADATVLLSRLDDAHALLLSLGGEASQAPDVWREQVEEAARRAAPTPAVPLPPSSLARESWEAEAEDASAAAALCAGLQARLADLLAVVAAETEAMERYREENDRRRHNYIPFIVTLLRGLAREGRLQPMYERGQKKAADARDRMRREAMAAKGAAAAAVGGTGTG